MSSTSTEQCSSKASGSITGPSMADGGSRVTSCVDWKIVPPEIKSVLNWLGI